MIIWHLNTKEQWNVFATNTHFIKIKSHLSISCIIAFNQSDNYKQSNNLPDIIGKKGTDVKRDCPSN